MAIVTKGELKEGMLNELLSARIVWFIVSESVVVIVVEEEGVGIDYDHDNDNENKMTETKAICFTEIFDLGR